MDRFGRWIAACGLLLAVMGRVGLAQDVGDTVRARQSVELKVEDKAVATVSAGDELTVRKASDKWLWVQTATGQRGWVLKEAVSSSSVTSEPPARFPTPAEVQPATAKATTDPKLLAIGVLAGQNIYTTYAYIGAIADGYGGQTYEADKVQELMTEVSSMAQVVSDNLRQVQQTNLAPDDREAIDNVIEIMTLLRAEADALSKYAMTNSVDDLQAYDDARTAAWPKVRDILQLE